MAKKAISSAESSTRAEVQVKNNDAHAEPLGSMKSRGRESDEAGGSQLGVSSETKPSPRHDSQKPRAKMSDRKDASNKMTSVELASSDSEPGLTSHSDENKTESEFGDDFKGSWERMELSPSSDGYVYTSLDSDYLAMHAPPKTASIQDETTSRGRKFNFGIDPEPKGSFRTPTVQVEDSAIEVSTHEEFRVSQKRGLDAVTNNQDDAPFDESPRVHDTH